MFLTRKNFNIHLTVLKTSSRSLVEHTKANKITKFKELGKMTL